LDWVFERNGNRILTFILMKKRLRLLHVLALNSIHLATPIFNYFGHALRAIVLRALFVNQGLLEVVFEVSNANSATGAHNSLN